MRENERRAERLGGGESDPMGDDSDDDCDVICGGAGSEAEAGEVADSSDAVFKLKGVSTFGSSGRRDESSSFPVRVAASLVESSFLVRLGIYNIPLVN